MTFSDFLKIGASFATQIE